jgi:putative PEP-CTERM system TPR-repeat lipoprotein
LAIFGKLNRAEEEKGPSSLLAGAPLPAGRSEDDPDVCQVSPSSLLGDEPPRPMYSKEERVGALVSPGSLLPPPPAAASPRRKKYAWGAGLVLALVVWIAFLAVKPQKPVPELMEEAKAYQARGDNIAASIMFKNVVDREPDNSEAHLLLGKAYIATGALLDAEKELKRARDLGVPAAETVPLSTQILIDLDRPEDALKALNDSKLLLAKVPSETIALLLGRAYLGVGNTVEARTQFNIARGKLPGPAMAGLARVMLREGDTDGASKLLDDVIAKHPNTVEAWLAKGDLRRAQEKPTEAVAAYRAAESLAPSSLEAILSSAITLIGQEELVEARRELRKARDISPASHLLSYANAVLALREKRYDECREWLQSVLSVVPRHMPTVYLAGMLNLAVGHLEQAQDAFNDYLARFPGSIQARKMLAIVLLKKQRPQAAVDIVAPLAELDIKDASFLLVAGEAYLQTGSTERARALLTKAARLDSSNPAILTSLGTAQLAAGARDSAISEYEKAVALEPTNPFPYRRLAITLMAKGRIDDALAVAAKLEKHIPASPEHHWLRGLAYSLRKDAAKARESYEAALKADPKFFPAAAALAEQALSSGDGEGARARFEALLNADPANLDASFALAKLDANGGKVDQALSRVQRLVDAYPDNVAGQVLLAELQRRSGQLDAALGTARRARESDPLNPSAAELLGKLQVEAKDIAGAVQSFTALVNMRPRSLPGRLQLAEVQNSSGQRRAAIVTLQEALALGPGNAHTFAFLVELMLQEKQYAEAFEVADKAKKQLPKRAVGLALEGEIHLAKGDAKQALVAFKSASLLEPIGRLQIRLHQAQSSVLGRDAPIEPLLDWLKKHPRDDLVRLYAADALVRFGRIPEAIEMYMALLERDSNNYRVLNNLADAMVRQGDPRALEYAQRAFQARPNDSVIASTLGLALLNGGKAAEALQVLRKAVTVDPDNGEVRYQYILALVKVGDRERAKSELSALLALGKPFPKLAEAQMLANRL